LFVLRTERFVLDGAASRTRPGWHIEKITPFSFKPLAADIAGQGEGSPARLHTSPVKSSVESLSPLLCGMTTIVPAESISIFAISSPAARTPSATRVNSDLRRLRRPLAG